MEYFLLKSDGEQSGTYSIEQIRKMLKEGFIGHDVRYWHDGIAEWQPIDRIEESVNFRPPEPEPAPFVSNQSKKAGIPRAASAPPPATKLERAVPGTPQKRVANPYTPRREPAPATTGPAVSYPTVPEPTVTQIEPGEPEDKAVPEVEQPAPAPAHAPQNPARRAFDYILNALPISLVAVAIAIAVQNRNAPDSPLGRITLAAGTTYVLYDQASIKPFEDELRESDVAQSLQNQMAQATDPAAAQRLAVSAEKERANHVSTVCQEYIQNNKAAFIDAGTYTALAYFDNNGTLIQPREGDAWVAINYNDRIVFVYKGADLDGAQQ
jgi:hypothetical protein